MPQTYCDSQLHPPIDWVELLEVGTMPLVEWQHLWNLAGSWHTCACGMQSVEIPRYSSGCPKDVGLAQLGENFCTAIEERRPTKALELFHLISRVSSQMLVEQAQTLPA